MTVALGGHPKGTGKKPLGSSSILLPGKADCPHPAEPAPESPECEVTPTALPSPCARPSPHQREGPTRPEGPAEWLA